MLFAGWFLIAGFTPLHQPSAGAEEIATVFCGNENGIRLGMVIVILGAAIFLPFTATVADFVSRVEGRNGTLTRIVTMAGYGNAMLTFYPPMFWLVAAFRPKARSAEITYLLNDIGWLQFIGGLSLVMPMIVVVGLCILWDKSPKPTFPRWAAFACFLGFVLMLPDQLLFFFKSGPFAWNGLIAFWMPMPVFCLLFIMFFWFLRREALNKGGDE